MSTGDLEADLATEFQRGFDKREDGLERLDLACEAGPGGPRWDYSRVEEAYQLLTEAADQLRCAVLLADRGRVRRVQLRRGKSQKVDDLRVEVADCHRDAARAAVLLEADDHAIDLLRRALEIVEPVRRNDQPTAACKGRAYNNLGYELMRRHRGAEDLAEAESLFQSAYLWYGRGGHVEQQELVKANQADLERTKSGEEVGLQVGRGLRTGPPIASHTGTVLPELPPESSGPVAWISSDDPMAVIIDGVRLKVDEETASEMQRHLRSEGFDHGLVADENEEGPSPGDAHI